MEYTILKDIKCNKNVSDKQEHRKSEVISLWNTDDVMCYVAAAFPRRLQWHGWNHLLVSVNSHCIALFGVGHLCSFSNTS